MLDTRSTSGPDLQVNSKKKRPVVSINENIWNPQCCNRSPGASMKVLYTPWRDLPGSKKKFGFSCDLETSGVFFVQRFYIHKFCQLHLGYLHPNATSFCFLGACRHGLYHIQIIYRLHTVDSCRFSRCYPYISMPMNRTGEPPVLSCIVQITLSCPLTKTSPFNDACWSSLIMPRQKAKHLPHTDSGT